MKKRPSVIIPGTELDTRLKEASRLHKEMTDLLRDLEKSATGKTSETPGGWRHDPTKWANRS